MVRCITHFMFTLHPLADLQYYIIWLMCCKMLNEGHWTVHISLCLQNWLARFGDRLPLRAPEVCCVRDVTQELHRIGNQLNTSPRAGNVQHRLSSFLQSSISRQDFVLKFQTVFHFKCQLLEKKVCINLQRFETLTDTTCDLCIAVLSAVTTSIVCASDTHHFNPWWWRKYWSPKHWKLTTSSSG
jgi:hypothetical protein